MTNRQPGKTEGEVKEAKELEEIYRQYFAPPSEEQAGEFRQVSLFDYSVPTYCSDSTIETERQRA